MLTQEHIDWYKMDIMRAQVAAIREVNLVKQRALKSCCKNCVYCLRATRHRMLIESTSSNLLRIVRSLQPGANATLGFPKKMLPYTTFYRGFILDSGEYIDMFATGHEKYRRKYAEEYGEDRAYRMITVHTSGVRTQVHFFDRKYAPADMQYATLRELMIDAEGSLCFHFSYDTTHPI